jgi:hypothetical protein
MKRREFVKNVSLASIALANGSKGSFGMGLNGCDQFSLPGTFSINGFEDEQEECPKLVSNGKGENWMFSLRRLPYPQNTEEIATYQLVKGKWIEGVNASTETGHYESPTAVCLAGEEPIVAWINIENGKWDVQVTHYKHGKPAKPIVFASFKGRAANPGLVEAGNGNVWLIWENYYQARFSVCVSKYKDGSWSTPKQVTSDDKICFDPAIAEGKDGKVYLIYSIKDGIHRNIEMQVFEDDSLTIAKKEPVAIGGGLENRVNLNTKPALAFDNRNRLWISWESNRNTSMPDDCDNYSGDRCCSMVCYSDGELLEPESGKWLFEGKNDHLPAFVKDNDKNLFAFTRCGGDFRKSQYWMFRVSTLQPDGWTEPEVILTLDQKGQTAVPTIIFNKKNEFWLAWCFEQFSKSKEGIRIKQARINLTCFKSPKIRNGSDSNKFKPAVIEEHHPEVVINKTGGRHRIARRKMVLNGEEYTLILGDLHEHTEGSYCWPAGTDGTLHDDYRYGLYSEGYDFVGMTDHTSSMDEPYWRKSLRTADFYNEDGFFIAIPSAEWTLSPPQDYQSIPRGVGHRNVIFASTKEAEKFIRNGKEIYSEFSPECDTSPKLWQLIREKNIDCVAIPHHVSDSSHPVCWQVRDEEIEPVVELFQCRGNAEYPGCPRENNLDRHRTTHFKEAFVDYALREKGYRLGFIGSGEHNNMGVGLAALWVKEVNRKGILEALRARRCFGTTGDKIVVDFKVNNAFMGQTVKLNGIPEIFINAQGVKPLGKVELMRNSRVLKSWVPDRGSKTFSFHYTDNDYFKEKEVLYYYVRITQINEQMAWSSPVFVQLA